MSDLIDRQKAIEALDFEIVHMIGFSNDEKNITNPFAQYNKGLEDGIKAIRALPSAEPERKKGKWSNYKDEHSCSVCHCVVIQENWDDDIRYDYCPYCGAEVGKGEE